MWGGGFGGGGGGGGGGGPDAAQRVRAAPEVVARSVAASTATPQLAGGPAPGGRIGHTPTISQRASRPAPPSGAGGRARAGALRRHLGRASARPVPAPCAPGPSPSPARLRDASLTPQSPQPRPPRSPGRQPRSLLRPLHALAPAARRPTAEARRGPPRAWKGAPLPGRETLRGVGGGWARKVGGPWAGSGVPGLPRPGRTAAAGQARCLPTAPPPAAAA